MIINLIINMIKWNYYFYDYYDDLYDIMIKSYKCFLFEMVTLSGYIINNNNNNNININNNKQESKIFYPDRILATNSWKK